MKPIDEQTTENYILTILTKRQVDQSSVIPFCIYQLPKSSATKDKLFLLKLDLSRLKKPLRKKKEKHMFDNNHNKILEQVVVLRYIPPI